MKITKLKNSKQLLSLMRDLNYCYDASMRKIYFTKERSISQKDGSLIYPFERWEDRVVCSVHVELLLNSYTGAKKNQIVTLDFEGVRSLVLHQSAQQDFSDVYDVKVRMIDTARAQVVFRSTVKKLPLLKLSCERVRCRQL